MRAERTKKLRATAFDGIAAALSPVLIIGMIAALVFFLVIAFYQGEYDVRLMYILALFTVATVLIARIAIESGRGHANLFAAPLAIVAMLAMSRFVTITGEFAPLSWLVNVGLLALTWYLADRITFDCTLLEDDRESLQSGLLQTLGGLSGLAEESQAGRPAPKQPIGATALKKAKHNPGIWVLYFSLLAFPLFGLGQLVIPGESPRKFAFILLVTYLGCALALLTTTSLLAMRRYVRQRGVSMPADITRSWLGLGVALSVAVLLICMLLPLPGRTLGLVGLPFEMRSPDGLSTSRWGWGQEGRRPGERASAVQQPKQADAKQQPAGRAAQNAKRKDGQAPSEPGDSPPSNAQQASEPQNDSQQGDSQQGESQQGGSPQGDAEPKSQSQGQEHSSNDAPKGQPDGKPNDGKPNSQKNSPQGNTPQSDASQNGGKPKGEQANQQPNQPDSRQPQPDKNREGQRRSDDAQQKAANENAQQPEEKPKGDDPKPEPKKSEKPQAKPQTSPSSSWQQIISQLGPLIKWLTIAVLAAIVLYYVATHPGEVAKLWRDLLNLLAGLFGRPHKPNAAVAVRHSAPQQSPVQRRTFQSYANPFAQNLNGWQAAQVIEHSFAALEAWAAERGRPRQTDQTAEEFARKLVTELPQLVKLPTQAAAMLDRVMFAGWTPSIQDLTPLAELWRKLESQPTSTAHS